ncbi:MAG TPA: TIGR00730 family Rossman fold protein [Thermoanaerobaculia bacterium]|jgi:uncharacterized protein (TIGR00730 family)
MQLQRICVYCGSGDAKPPAIEKELREFGRALAKRGVTLVYGGASTGLMGALADETLGAAGKVIGIIPKALEGREVAHRGLTELKVVETMHEREQLMFELADGFVAFPGGFGTLEEVIEMITWKRMGIHGKPILLVNVGGYFNPLLQQFDAAIATGFARREDRVLFSIADNAAQAMTMLEGAPVLDRKAGDWA